MPLSPSTSKALATAIILMGLTAGAVAQATPAQTSAQSTNQTADTSSAGNITVKAGRTVDLDVSQSSLTDKWAGFFGNVSASKVLGDGSNNLYKWQASTIPSNAEVIVTPKGDATPTSLNPVNDPNNFLGSGFDSGVANASATFELDESRNVLGNDVSTAAVNTYNNESSTDSEFTTFLYENADATDQPVYVAEANPNTKGFTNELVNYQLLVGVGESASSETFTFYLELP